MAWGRIYDSLIAEQTAIDPTGRFDASMLWVNLAGITPTPQLGWSASETNGTWSFTAPPPPPAPTLAEQAITAMSAGLTISSAGTPALDGTYACDDTAQANLNSMYNLIQRAGGNAFPGGLSALPWPLLSGAVVTFTSVSAFLAVETAIGDYVLTLDLVVTTNAGTLPPATASIA
ncbi:hypothetical protein [Rhodopila sp.]|uniref:hypothetical protein n=1 Tax=Rhodopila sp. TaxID=2480087 RepID=UPI003D0BCCA3